MKKDITGMRFGKLTVTGPEESAGSGKSYWRCRCDCGEETVVEYYHLIRGTTKSCGCLRQEYQREAIKTSLHIVDGTCIEKISSKAMFSNNTSGARGVYRNGAGKWKAAIGFRGKVYNLGTYADYYDAVAARKAAEENLYIPFLEEYKKGLHSTDEDLTAAVDPKGITDQHNCNIT